MSISYRPEIDGLRTVAVCSVLLYHLKIPVEGGYVLPGGFLGVDVFFVISGFLITSLIRKEWTETGGFSIANFYERRARRLLPALFGVILASLAAATLILLPSAMIDFLNSIAASIFFVSNMYWYFAQQAYGATDGLYQPFLHTWSLAVEEQFYLLFPLLYMLLLRRLPQRLLAVALVAMVLGLFGAELMTKTNFALSFFWLPSRIWELLAGAALAHLLMSHSGCGRSWRVAPLLPGVGLALILASLVGMNLHWHHPGFGTVGAVLGAVLVIWFAAPGEPVTRLLSSRPFVLIGLISYSLYLWHYPIFSFGRMLRATPGPADWIVWLVLSFGLAILGYRLVERPYRQRSVVSLRMLIGSGAAALAVVATFAVAMVATDGMRGRFPSLIALYGPNEFDNDVLMDDSWRILADLAAVKGYGPSKPQAPSDFEASELWFDPASDDRRVLIVGSSHGKDMFNAFHLNRDAFSGLAFARFGMGDRLPADQIGRLLAAPNFAEADTVLLSFRYGEPTLARLPVLIEAIKARDKEVLVLLNTVEFDDIDHKPLFDWYLTKNGSMDPTALSQIAWEHRQWQRTDKINAQLREVAARYGLPVRDKSRFICDSAQERCSVVTEDGHKAFYDYGHFTLEGAAYFGRRIAQSGWLGLPADAS